ncbi:hypothetical protein [Sinimarinibacterium sp. CAU 1509]|nr:hypothetical protein [Sinimarinibacterium sp. CAU 1509]
MSEGWTRLLRDPRLSRLAQLSFWFFLIKGLLWLLVPVALVWFGGITD